jgi:hypothetical protein
MKKLTKSATLLGKTCLFTFSLLIMFVISQCSSFPSNPNDSSSVEKWVEIKHVQTEYITTETSVSGLAADKVNLLSFEIQANNFDAAALEVYGRVILEGPPYGREHNLHFRTDKLLQTEAVTGVCIQTIQSDLPYLLVRSKYPTNEYSPFSGDQGKVVEVELTNVIAYDADGNAKDVPFNIVQ